MAMQLAIEGGAERDGVDGFGPVYVREHLVAREHELDGTLKLQRRHDREIDLVLRAQARAEGAADEWRHDTDVVLRQSEDTGQIRLVVLDALDLVVDGDLASALPDHGRRMCLHGIVMLNRDPVLLPDLDGRGIECRIGVAARLGWGRDARRTFGGT